MIPLALIGAGKIARDQHLPAIHAVGGFNVVATVDPAGVVDGLPGFASLDELLASGPPVAAVAVCTPPAIRHEVAATAIRAGLHVLLEKPPAATLSQADHLVGLAERHGVALFAAWHSREANGVAKARAWLADKAVRAVRVTWREDVRRWHPGQEWIFAAGGYGVFDPGINALSILTALLPAPPVLKSAVLHVPAGRAAPIAAELALTSGDAPIAADFDFREAVDQQWRIEIDTAAGAIVLSDGGRTLELPGAIASTGPDREYPRLYRRFASLVDARAIDVDVAPLRLVADAFLVGKTHPTEAFRF